jgi:hypothetical protein
MGNDSSVVMAAAAHTHGLEFHDGKHIVICVNRDNPGMHKNAQRILTGSKPIAGNATSRTLRGKN